MDNPILKYFTRLKNHNLAYSVKIRDKYLTSSLPNPQKMEMYNAATNNKIETFIQLIEVNKYPIMEECSSSGYYWTSLHYAAHYGSYSIVEYILNYLSSDPDSVDKVNLQSNLGLSPLLIAIKNCSDIEAKKAIMELFVKYDCIDYNIVNLDNEDIFDICQNTGLLNYFLSLIKED